MDISGDIGIRLCIVAVLLVLSAFFSSAETALTTVNQIRIRNLMEAGNKQAEYVSRLCEDRGKMLSAILIGNNVVNLSASSMVTVLVTDLMGSRFAGIGTGILTLLILIFGEITPKTMATLQAEKYSLRVGRVIYLLMVVLTPVISLVNLMSSWVLKALKVDAKGDISDMTEDEFRTIVKVGHEQGVIEEEEKEIINNLFDLDDCVAKDIMVPRIDMVFVSLDASYNQVLETFRQEHYTRMPVYQDSTDNAVGIINVKDLLLVKDKRRFSVKDYMREPYYTYESKNLSDLLMDMKKTSNNIAIILDEYGATAGLVTMEDLLEEIVGDIRDEYDGEEEEELVEINPGEYLVSGSMKLDDLNECLGFHLESQDYDSVGGLIIGLLGHVPSVGEETAYKGIRLQVEALDKNRIDQVRIQNPSPEAEGEKEAVDG